jgi:hypothetical protein
MQMEGNITREIINDVKDTYPEVKEILSFHLQVNGYLE